MLFFSKEQVWDRGTNELRFAGTGAPPFLIFCFLALQTGFPILPPSEELFMVSHTGLDHISAWFFRLIDLLLLHVLLP